MESLKRVIIRDKSPIFDGAIVAHPLNRLALGIAALALGVQAAGLVQVVQGYGNAVGFFDHASFAVVAFAWLVLGVTVFIQRAGTSAARRFLLSSAAGSAFLGVGTLSGVSLPDALLYTAGVLLFAPMTWGFVRALDSHRAYAWWDTLLYIPPVPLIPFMALDLFHGQKHFGYRAGVASVGIYMLTAVAQAVRGLAAARTAEAAAQMRAVVIGLVGGTLPGILLFVVPLALFGQLVIVTTLQPLIALVFLLAMSYAALLFEFAEADLIMRRGIVYGVMTSVIVIAYGGLGAVLAAGGLSVVNPAGGFGFVCVTIFIGAAFTPARQIAYRFADWLLFTGVTDRWSILQRLTLRLGTVMQPQDLGEILVHDLEEGLHVRGAFFFRRQGDDFLCTAQHGRWTRKSDVSCGISGPTLLRVKDVQAALGEPPVPLLLVHARPFFLEGQSGVPEEFRIFDDLGAALVIPLTVRSGLEAILCLGPKETHDAFTAEDLQLLTPIAGRAAAALDNSLLFSRLDDTVRELREAYVRVAHEQEVERSRLARELHDGTSQELATMITFMSVLERQIESGDPEVLHTLSRLRNQAEEAYGGVRRSSHALRPVILDGRGLVPALVHYIDQFREMTRIAVEMSAEDLGSLPPHLELALFRVVQECMENVRKHSGSPTARVTLTRGEGVIRLSIADDGRGIEEPGHGGIGMVSMRERLTAVGGTFHIRSARNEGVQVEAVVPLSG